ncbi:MAG: hypothetical protein WCY77_05605 [Weeksellaceae bacterium]
MKNLFKLVFLLFAFQFSMAQKVEYKKNIISVNKVDLAKVEVIKENFGLTKNFNLYAMNGEKLIIAVLSMEYEADKSDNTSMYYRLTFVPTNQVGIFKLSSLGQEKGFVNLIGKGNIIDGNQLDADKVAELIATKGVTPRTAVHYNLVQRNVGWPIKLQPTHKIEQDNTEIGFFKVASSVKGQDAYEFFIPSGILVAKVNFAGGNNAQNFELFTPKDKQRRVVSIPQKEVVKHLSSSVDPNELTLRRVVKWLVDNKYL